MNTFYLVVKPQKISNKYGNNLNTLNLILRRMYVGNHQTVPTLSHLDDDATNPDPPTSKQSTKYQHHYHG